MRIFGYLGASALRPQDFWDYISTQDRDATEVDGDSTMERLATMNSPPVSPLQRLAIITPVLDDWESFKCLARDVVVHLPESVNHLELIAVDDGFRELALPGGLDLPDDPRLSAARIIRLELNLGHQRAIAVGLSSIARRTDLDAVVVMDSDGEDRPEDIPRLMAAANFNLDQVVLARRARRSESTSFKIAYVIYKLMFRILTGRPISFGNFCLLPIRAVRRLVYMPELWNNLPAAIIRSRLPFLTVDTSRGWRYAGVSHMNVASLVLHGMSAVSVYTDVVLVRALITTGTIFAISLTGMLGVVMVRLLTSLAIPGWATVVFGDLLIILVQAVMMTVAMSLMVLTGRSTRAIVPLADSPLFVGTTVEVIHRVTATSDQAHDG